jgi:hypothetical protein
VKKLWQLSFWLHAFPIDICFDAKKISRSFLHAYFLIALTLLLLATFAGMLAMLQ